MHSVIAETYSTQLLTYQAIQQAEDCYNEGNSSLESWESTGDEKCLHEAIDLYDKATNLNPGFALAWNNKGCVLNQLGKYEEALVVLEQAVEFDETLVIAFNNRGDALQGLGKNEEAMVAYEQSINLEPENYQAWLGKGSCLYDLQRYEEGLEISDKLITLDSENFLGWYSKASCLALLGKRDQALESLKEAARLNHDAVHKLANTDTDFDALRNDERFKELMGSSVGVSYGNLKNLLEAKQWMKADKETARLIKIVIQKVTNLTEIDQNSLSVFPYIDLNTIDTLWRESSDGQFGFSVQKEIYLQSFKDRDIFGNKIGWRVRDTNGNHSAAQ